MSRKSNQLRKRLAIADARQRRADRELEEAQGAAAHYRHALARADDDLAKVMRKSRTEVHEAVIDDRMTEIRVTLMNAEIQLGAEALIGMTARRIASDLMEYSVKHGLVTRPNFEDIPEGPRVMDFLRAFPPGASFPPPRDHRH